MRTALCSSFLLVGLLGSAWPVSGQGSMSRFTTTARTTIGWGKSPIASSTNGFTISAQRDFDYKVAIAVSSATRYWFQDCPRQSEILCATVRYENATLWAQATPLSPGLAFAAACRSPDTRAVAIAARTIEYREGSTINRFDAASPQDDDSQTPVWLQSNVRFANVNPVP